MNFYNSTLILFVQTNAMRHESNEQLEPILTPYELALMNPIPSSDDENDYDEKLELGGSSSFEEEECGPPVAKKLKLNLKDEQPGVNGKSQHF